MNPILPPGLPAGFDAWPPLLQAVTLGLLTFVQEDVPTVGGALLAAAGAIAWEVCFAGVFLGIWLGDALLYVGARAFGRPLLQRAWARRFVDPAAIARSEAWFTRRGTWLLLSSRFVPGTRLPTYLAAGFLRLPFPRFLSVTGLAVATWTAGVFVLARVMGPGLVRHLRVWENHLWVALLVIAVGVIVLRAAPRGLRWAGKSVARRLPERWTRWEFWPPWLFYLPIGINYLRLALKHRGLMLPTAANPGIYSGGMVGESKIEILRDLLATSPEFTAEAHLVAGDSADQRVANFRDLISRHKLTYPLVLKPDIGQRGAGVKVMAGPDPAIAYLRSTRAPLLVQRYAPGPREVGVFYHRLPSEPRGRIFAITEKWFPSILGDGVHTIEELIRRDARARFAAATYLRRWAARRHDVLPVGESFPLVQAGNHAQGCVFRDGAHLWSAELEARLDEISQRLEGFYVGRYDIRFDTEADLRAGEKFQIIELNGAAAEATNAYDARHSLARAYQILFQQWAIVFAVGAANRARGTQTTALVDLWRAWRRTSRLIATYPPAD